MVAYFLAAIVLALLVEELSGVSPGGIVSAGYLALLLDNLALLGATLAVAIVTVGAIRIGERFMLLYGRRRLAFAILAGATIKAILAVSVPALDPSMLGAAGLLGFVTPGLIADWTLRQGAAPTACALAVTVAAMGLMRVGLAL